MTPDQIPPGLAQLAQLRSVGLLQDPLEKLTGLINLVNAFQQPQMQTRELDLRQQGMQMDYEAAMTNQGIAQQELEMRKLAQLQNDEQFMLDYELRKRLAKENRLLEIEQLRANQDYQRRMLGLQALGLPAQYSGSEYRVNTEALQPAMQTTGLLGFFTPNQAATGMPAGLNADQQELWKARQRLYPTQTNQ